MSRFSPSFHDVEPQDHQVPSSYEPHYLMALAPLAAHLSHFQPFIGAAQNLDLPYVKPKQKVYEFVALGDSYTAGVGANGESERLGEAADRGVRSYPMQMYKDVDMWQIINGDRKQPRFTFLAHTTDRFHNVLQDQLTNEGWFEENSWDRARGVHFGHPQLAVMTVGGNDAHFAEVLNDCVYRIWMPKSCQGTLDNIKKELDDGSLEEKIRNVMMAVVNLGRKARGARPPESFQLYVPEYVSFFNEKNRQCDRVDWHFHRNVFADKIPLTKDLRHRLNLITEQFNAATKRAAEDLKDMGVFFVDDINHYYDGHRYCEFGQTSEKMDHLDTWFWSPHSPSDTTGEGRLAGGSKSRWKPSLPDRRNVEEDPIQYAVEEQVLLDFVFGNQTLNETLVKSGVPPWEWPGAEKYPTFLSLINAMQLSTATQLGQLGEHGIKEKIMKWLSDIFLPFRYLRSFHPKGTGHEVIKERIFAAILQNREIALKNTTEITQRLTGTVVLG